MHFTNNKLEYISLKPDKLLAGTVESIWMVKNYSEEKREGIIIPDGKIDLFFLEGENNSFEIFISGICTHPIIKPPFPRSTMFAVSFHPIAAEYIFKHSFSDLKNNKQTLHSDYWGFSKNDLVDFEHFYNKACRNIALLLTKRRNHCKGIIGKSFLEQQANKPLFQYLVRDNTKVISQYNPFFKFTKTVEEWGSVSQTELWRPVPFYKGSEEIFGSATDSIEQERKRPIYPIEPDT
jgi:hypothetical protein